MERGLCETVTLKAEDVQQVTVETPDGKPVSVPLKEIDERTPSVRKGTRAALRDVIEFLATLSP